jgi:hypothetical protein
MAKTMLLALLLIQTGLYAETTASPIEVSANPGEQAPSPSAAVAPVVPGPFPEQKNLPVNVKQLPESPQTDARKMEMKKIERRLQSKRLSPERRKALEQRLGELNAEVLSQPSKDLP